MIWSVHEAATGELKAETQCGSDRDRRSTASRGYPAVASPDGRYMAAGPVAFDLKRRKGVCLQGDGDRKTILLAAVRNDGTAYGGVEDRTRGSSKDTVVAEVDLSDPTGATKALGVGTDIPIMTDVNGSGLFITRDADRNILVSLRSER
ncbi:hypothetical protein HX747_01990 [Streptomyces sp. L06]|nr:hypothetical protein [Streptomyces sp. L06]